jgi:hypothetical protein
VEISKNRISHLSILSNVKNSENKRNKSSSNNSVKQRQEELDRLTKEQDLIIRGKYDCCLLIVWFIFHHFLLFSSADNNINKNMLRRNGSDTSIKTIKIPIRSARTSKNDAIVAADRFLRQRYLQVSKCSEIFRR